jgi:hypothetical protein
VNVLETCLSSGPGPLAMNKELLHHVDVESLTHIDPLEDAEEKRQQLIILFG